MPQLHPSANVGAEQPAAISVMARIYKGYIRNVVDMATQDGFVIVASVTEPWPTRVRHPRPPFQLFKRFHSAIVVYGVLRIDLPRQRKCKDGDFGIVIL